jgi:heme exporter protein A
MLARLASAARVGRTGVRRVDERRPLIRAEELEKRYGTRIALRGLSFDVLPDGVLVVTGPNGSGKTTLLRLLVGLAAPSRGRLALALDRGRIGYVGHEPILYRELTALENLDLFGRLYRVRERRERIGMLLERFALWDVRAERVGAFSRGMTQRLALCRALLHEPELLVLDEPHSGLDEDGAALLDAELLSPPDAPRTLVVATHEPARLARLATQSLALGRS